MKSIYLPLIILAFVLIFSVVSGEICQKTLKEIIGDVENLPDIPNEDTKGKIEKLIGKWEKNVEFYSIVSKYDYIANAAKEMQTLLAGCSSDDKGTYLAAKKTLIDSLEYIKDIQTVRLDNIF